MKKHSIKYINMKIIHIQKICSSVLKFKGLTTTKRRLISHNTGSAIGFIENGHFFFFLNIRMTWMKNLTYIFLFFLVSVSCYTVLASLGKINANVAIYLNSFEIQVINILMFPILLIAIILIMAKIINRW